MEINHRKPWNRRGAAWCDDTHQIHSSQHQDNGHNNEGRIFKILHFYFYNLLSKWTIFHVFHELFNHVEVWDGERKEEVWYLVWERHGTVRPQPARVSYSSNHCSLPSVYQCGLLANPGPRHSYKFASSNAFRLTHSVSQVITSYFHLKKTAGIN